MGARHLLLGRRGFLAFAAAGAAASGLKRWVFPAAATEGTGGPGLDTILRSGTVVDGSGGAPFVADVGVAGGHIATVGDLSGVRAAREIDARGLVVSPGFIDVHSHGDLDALVRAESSLRQGVTTELLHPDGGGILRIAQRLSVEEDGLGINIGVYIGFNEVWDSVVGREDRRATPEEIEWMRRRVLSGLENGAWGVSAGLAYSPAVFAQTDQIIDVVESARPWRTNFPDHIRNENDAVIEATDETITIGEDAGLVPVVTHMKVMGPGNWGKSNQTVGLIEQANARGTYTAADVYPYLRSQTGINATIPSWVQEGGEDAMFERFNDPQLRPQIEKEIEEVLHRRVPGPEGVWIRAIGQTLDEAAQARWDDSPVSPGEAVMRIRVELGNASCIWSFGHEDDFRRILQNPTTAVASDGGASTSSTTHPRYYGTFPRVLGHYVREQGLLSLEAAVFKMTYLPASMIGMVDRGLLAPGMSADITVFDPDTVIDKATFEQPNQLAEGVRHVLVNGRLALTSGDVVDGLRAGKSLRRRSSMISRPRTGSDPAEVSVSGRLVPLSAPAPDGQVFATDFSDNAVGQPPSGWTGQWRDGDWTVLDNPRRLRMGATSGRRALTWDAVGDIDGDAELYGRVRAHGNRTLFHLGLLISGDAGDENTYFLRVRHEDAGGTANQLQIGRYLNGGYFTQDSKTMPFPVREDAWYHVLVQRQGDWMRGKMWPDGETEPAEYQVAVSTYDIDLLADGRGGVGPSHCCSGAVTEWSFLAVGTGGERAPRRPGDPPPVSDHWRQAQLAFSASGTGTAASGHLLLVDRDRDLVFRSTALGTLQVADDWASATGFGRIARQRRERSFYAIFDRSDPLSDAQATVTVEIEDGYTIKGVLENGQARILRD